MEEMQREMCAISVSMIDFIKMIDWTELYLKMIDFLAVWMLNPNDLCLAVLVFFIVCKGSCWTVWQDWRSHIVEQMLKCAEKVTPQMSSQPSDLPPIKVIDDAMVTKSFLCQQSYVCRPEGLFKNYVWIFVKCFGKGRPWDKNKIYKILGVIWF